VPEPISPAQKLNQLLRGFPESAITACSRYQETRSLADFETATNEIIQHHLDKEKKVIVSELPEGTTLVEELGLDSLTMVEMVFLFEDIFAAEVPIEELTKIKTLGELRIVLRNRLPSV
jgi:acyl carrier protein